jgi:hypothetical protein
MNHLKHRWLVRSFMALALMITLGLMTAAAAPQASAHALTTSKASTFVPVGSNEYSNIVVDGVTIGYVETLTDGQGNYEEYAHASIARPYGLLLMSGDNYAVSSYSGTTQDVYLSLKNGGSPSYAFLEVDFLDTGALYYAGYGN